MTRRVTSLLLALVLSAPVAATSLKTRVFSVPSWSTTAPWCCSKLPRPLRHWKYMPASEPRMHARLKPVLNPGAKMTVAAEGFRTAEEFAAVAHAARNTNVPFMVLKHRVVEEGQTLERALRDVKPDVDAKAEVARAQAAAKSDVAAIAG